MADKIICIASIIGAISSFLLFISFIAEGIRLYKDAYTKEAKAVPKAMFLVSGAILAFGIVCVILICNYWGW